MEKAKARTTADPSSLRSSGWQCWGYNLDRFVTPRQRQSQLL